MATAVKKRTVAAAAKRKSASTVKTARRKTITTRKAKNSYDRFKVYNGEQYTGMAVGRTHKWYYDKGIWKDKKLTPDKWEINYEVVKRRAGKAPKGSGAAVGTEYHWYIIAHQLVKKLDANSYSTAMNGYKFKVAHKRAGKDQWNISDKAQQKRMIRVLEDLLAGLRSELETV